MPTKQDVTKQHSTFEYDGETYSVPPADDWSLEALEAVDEGKMTTAVRELLGEEQYAKFKSGGRRTVGDLGKLFEAAGEAVNGGKS